MAYNPPPINNDHPIEHTTRRGVVFKCDRADLSVPIMVLDQWDDLIGLERFAEAVAEFTAWHVLNILDRLNGFRGYDTLRFEVIEGEQV